MARIAYHLSTGKSSTGATCWMPALLTSRSMQPNSPSARPIIASMASTRLMSAPSWRTSARRAARRSRRAANRSRPARRSRSRRRYALRSEAARDPGPMPEVGAGDEGGLADEHGACSWGCGGPAAAAPGGGQPAGPASAVRVKRRWVMSTGKNRLQVHSTQMRTFAPERRHAQQVVGAPQQPRRQPGERHAQHLGDALWWPVVAIDPAGSGRRRRASSLDAGDGLAANCVACATANCAVARLVRPSAALGVAAQSPTAHSPRVLQGTRPSAAVTMRPRCVASPSRSTSGWLRAPIVQTTLRDASRAPPARSTPPASTARSLGEPHVDAALAQRPRCRLAEPGRQFGQQPLAVVQQRDAQLVARTARYQRRALAMKSAIAPATSTPRSRRR